MKYLKTIITIGLCLNMGLTLSAQDIKRFKLDAFYGIENVETNNKGTSIFEPRNKKQTAKNGGLNVSYGINDRFFVKMGLRVTLLTGTTFSNLFIECGNTTQEEIDIMTANLKAETFEEIAFSSGVRYYFHQKKPLLNMYVEGSSDITHTEQGITPALGFAYGFDISLSQKVAIFIQPTYRFRINKSGFESRLDPKIQQHNVGVAMGLRF